MTSRLAIQAIWFLLPDRSAPPGKLSYINRSSTQGWARSTGSTTWTLPSTGFRHSSDRYPIRRPRTYGSVIRATPITRDTRHIRVPAFEGSLGTEVRIVMSEDDLHTIEARAETASGERWLAGGDDDGATVVHVEHRDGSTSVMRLTRDLGPASEADVAFVAHSRDDIGRLVRAIRGQARLTAEDIRQIAARSDQASNGPWQAFLESDGGMPGSNMISIPGGDYEPDLYLWLDTRIAPDADFEFVAHARQDIPSLLKEVPR
jgi:hypothetical protein